MNSAASGLRREITSVGHAIVVETLPLSEAVRDGLLGSGPYPPYLEAVIAYERGRWADGDQDVDWYASLTTCSAGRLEVTTSTRGPSCQNTRMLAALRCT